MSKKEKYKLPMSASHLTLYVALIVFFGTAVFGIITAQSFITEYPEYTVQILIGLFSFVGVCGTSTIAFYCNKSKAEHEATLANEKYEKRLELAMKIVEKISKGELSAEGINLAKALISDSDTSVITTGGLGGTTIIDEQKYNSTIPFPAIQTDNHIVNDYTVDDIIEKINLTNEGR